MSLLDKDNRTPYILACFYGHISIVNLLLDFAKDCFDINAVDRAGWNGFEWASYLDHSSIVSRLQELPEVMLQQRNALRQYHYPLHWACRVGNIENAKKLIDEGADVNSLDEILRTPLHWAAERGHSKIALSLMGFGYKFLSNAHQEDKYNATPFVLASSNESLFQCCCFSCFLFCLPFSPRFEQI